MRRRGRRHRVRPARRAQPRAVARVRAGRHPHRRLAPRAGLRVRGRRLRACDRRIGVALTTTGPGAANTLGAVGEAWASHSPVVVIASDIATTLRRPGTYRGVLHETHRPGRAVRAGHQGATRGRTGRGPRRRRRATRSPWRHRAPRGPGLPRGPDRSAQRRRSPDASRRCQPQSKPARDVAPTELDAAGSRCIERSTAAPDLDRRRHARRRRRGRRARTHARRARGRDLPGARRASGEPSAARRRRRRTNRQVTALVDAADFVLVDRKRPRPHEHDGMAPPAARTHAPRSTSTRADAAKNYDMARGRRGRRRRGATQRSSPHDRAASRRGSPTSPPSRARCEPSSAADPETAPAVDFLEHTQHALPDDAVVFADMCIPGYWLSGQHPVESRSWPALPDGLGHARLRVRRVDRRRGRGRSRPTGGRGDRRRRDALRARRARDASRRNASRSRSSSSTTAATACCATAARTIRTTAATSRRSTSSRSPRASASPPNGSTGSATTTARPSRRPSRAASRASSTCHALPRAAAHDIAALAARAPRPN